MAVSAQCWRNLTLHDEVAFAPRLYLQPVKQRALPQRRHSLPLNAEPVLQEVQTPILRLRAARSLAQLMAHRRKAHKGLGSEPILHKAGGVEQSGAA